MATHILAFATAQVCGLTTTQVAGMTAVLMSTAMNTAADLATINNAIIDDQKIISNNLGPGATTLQPAIIFTATSTKNSASMTAVTLVSPASSSIGAILPGMYICGVGLSPGTHVLSISGTTITLDRNAIATPTAGQSNKFMATQSAIPGSFVNGQLVIPNRGTLTVYPGDVVAVDIMGFPYLIPSSSINFNGGGGKSGAPWRFT